MAKGERLSAKLGPGAFEAPGPNFMARFDFLALIPRVAPEAITALEDDKDPGLWASRFGLHDVPWFVEVAAETLHLWSCDPSMRPSRVWPVSLGLPGRVVHELPDIRAWQYEDESEAAFDARIAEHKRDVQSAAASRGLTKMRELRNPLFVEWLVRAVFQQWNAETISEAYQTPTQPPDIRTVERGLNQAADLVGIPAPSTLKLKRRQ